MPGKLKNPKVWIQEGVMDETTTRLYMADTFELQEDFDEDIPYLTTIVINKETEIPTVFNSYLGWSNERIADAQKDVYCFKRWADVKEIIHEGRYGSQDITNS